MAQENPTRAQTTILILGTVRSEKQDFFSKLNSFSLLMVITIYQSLRVPLFI